MIAIPINERELHAIVLLHIALSEENSELRDAAIRCFRHEIIATTIALLLKECGPDWPAEPENTDLVKWIAATTAERQEAGHAVEAIRMRCRANNQRKLHVAELIGKSVIESISSGRFAGVQSPKGILAQVADKAKEASFSGAGDKDTLRKVWNPIEASFTWA